MNDEFECKCGCAGQPTPPKLYTTEFPNWLVLTMAGVGVFTTSILIGHVLAAIVFYTLRVF